MASHALDHRLFDLTENLASSPSAIPTSGPDRTDLVDGWLEVIKGEARAQIIAGKLHELRDLLKVDQPDADRVKDLLLTLADHTSQLAQGSNTHVSLAGQLEHLATSLRKLAGVEVNESR